MNKYNKVTAIGKIKLELEDAKDKRIPAEPIAKYLIDKCKLDDEFSGRVNLKEKTLKKCFSYVFNEVKKRLNGKNGWIDDNDVYQMAETYWLLNITDLEDIKIEPEKNPKPNKIEKTIEKDIETDRNSPQSGKKVNGILNEQQVSIFDIV